VGVFFLFLIALAAGCLSTLFWIPEEDLGKGYFITNALIILVLLALAVAVLWMHPFEPFGGQGALGAWLLVAGLVASFGYYVGIARERWQRARLAAALALTATLAALLLAGHALGRTDVELSLREPLLVLSLVGSALLLGWSLVTMLLGHWYLISPRLTFRYLVVFCSVLLGLVVARGLMVGAALASAASVGDLVEPHPWRLLVGFQGEGIFFWFRVLWGLAMTLILAFMSLHCARTRANQSATGILYVQVVGALVGETTALYLTLTTGVPV